MVIAVVGAPDFDEFLGLAVAEVAAGRLRPGSRGRRLPRHMPERFRLSCNQPRPGFQG